MLHAGALVEVEVLLDLGLATALGGLVDGELDVAVAVGHDLGHEGGVFGGDVVVVEVLVEGEAHDVGVEVDPLVHGVPAHVADDVVDVQQADRAGDGVVRDGLVAGEEGAGVVGAVDEGVDGVAVGGDAGGGDAAVVVGELGGLLDAACSAAGGLEPGLAGVVDPEGDGADAVAVLVDVAGDVGVGAEGCGEDEADFALLEDVAGAVALAGLGTGVGDQRHAECGAVEVGCLTGIAYEKLDVVGAFEGEEVWRGLKCVVLCGGGHGRVSPCSRQRGAARQREDMPTASGDWLGRPGRIVARHSPRPMRGWPGASQEPRKMISSPSARKVRTSPVGSVMGWAPLRVSSRRQPADDFGWAGDGSRGEQVANLEVAAVAGVVGDELSRSPVEITQPRLAQEQWV